MAVALYGTAAMVDIAPAMAAATGARAALPPTGTAGSGAGGYGSAGDGSAGGGDGGGGGSGCGGGGCGG
jgi:hypothetical protein